MALACSCVAVLVCGSPGAIASSGRAAGAVVTNGGSRIVGVPSGRCLDVLNGLTTPGTPVQLWNCLGDPQQAWVYSGGQLEVYGSSSMCLDADTSRNGANGTRVRVWPCTGAVNQRWVAMSDGTLRSAAYGRCLDAIDGGESNGTLLQLWDCIGDPQQDWIGPPIPNGGGPVMNAGSGRCLDVIDGRISPGSPLQLWNCLRDAQQQWVLSGRQLQVYADKCLDAVADGMTPGTPVQIWYCTGVPQQQWSWNADGTIRSLPSGLCLGAVYGGVSNGTPLQLQTCSGAPDQSWSRGSTAPASSPPPPAPAPASTPAPAATPIPPPLARHALRVRLVLSWTWRGKTTWLHGVRVGHLPAGTRLVVRCAGRGCPRGYPLVARGRRAIRQALRGLAGRRFRAGDVVSIALTAAGYEPERAAVVIEDGRKPRVRTVR